MTEDQRAALKQILLAKKIEMMRNLEGAFSVESDDEEMAKSSSQNSGSGKENRKGVYAKKKRGNIYNSKTGGGSFPFVDFSKAPAWWKHRRNLA